MCFHVRHSHTQAQPLGAVAVHSSASAPCPVPAQGAERSPRPPLPFLSFFLSFFLSLLFACPPSFALSWPSPLGSRVGGGRSLSQVSPSPLSSVSGTSLYCAAILDCPVREGNGRLCHVFPCASLAHTSTTARRCSGPQQRERPVSRPSSGGRKKSTGSCLVPALRSFAPLFSLSLAARWSSRRLPTRLLRVRYRRRLLLGEVFLSPLSTRSTAR